MSLDNLAAPQSKVSPPKGEVEQDSRLHERSSPPPSRSVTSAELIRLENIWKSYRRGTLEIPVLQGVSLTIARGELVALVGTSGSGKSTLMNLLGCLDRPPSGQYWLDGKEISTASPDDRANLRNTQIGFVFQNFNLLPPTRA